jgi:hypothetical protein
MKDMANDETLRKEEKRSEVRRASRWKRISAGSRAEERGAG